MFTDKNEIFLKKERLHDFITNCHQFGFIYDDESYIYTKYLSESDSKLYIQLTVYIDTLKIYIELHVPQSYWIEFGLNTFEPLFDLYKQGYIEIK